MNVDPHLTHTRSRSTTWCDSRSASLKVAQLRYDERAARWRLHSSGSDDRWHPYEFASPAPDVAPLLAAIEEDRTGIF